jgi:hypothetical protein
LGRMIYSGAGTPSQRVGAATHAHHASEERSDGKERRRSIACLTRLVERHKEPAQPNGGHVSADSSATQPTFGTIPSTAYFELSDQRGRERQCIASLQEVKGLAGNSEHLSHPRPAFLFQIESDTGAGLNPRMSR